MFPPVPYQSSFSQHLGHVSGLCWIANLQHTLLRMVVVVVLCLLSSKHGRLAGVAPGPELPLRSNRLSGPSPSPCQHQQFARANGTIGDMTWQSSASSARQSPPSQAPSRAAARSPRSPTATASRSQATPPRTSTRGTSHRAPAAELHFPWQAPGEPFRCAWKHHLVRGTGAAHAKAFFHLMQAFGVREHAPLVTLSVVQGDVVVKDYVRGTGGPLCGEAACPRVPLAKYAGRTTAHEMVGSFGPEGTLSYTVTDEDGTVLIHYAVNGSIGAGSGYVKFGIYRRAFEGMAPAVAEVGDWQSKRVLFRAQGA
ncbi:hypothetical protein B0H10DRAFT_1964938 [Mycena sp. CBHHK59/15]|nr:hypothetical protein B0H10DRAFT_1964938 [Mycena sp. CBHHK59/15]